MSSTVSRQRRRSVAHGRTSQDWLVLAMVCIVAALSQVGCRWVHAKSYQTSRTADPERAFVVVQEALHELNYQEVSTDAEQRIIRVRTHVDEFAASESSKVYIDVSVLPDGRIELSPLGALVSSAQGKIHPALAKELDGLMARLQRDVAGDSSGSVGTQSDSQERIDAAQGTTLPAAWNEFISSDEGNATCIPIAETSANSSVLLRVSTGTLLDLEIELRRRHGLCHASSSCPFAFGCLALAMKNSEAVNVLARDIANRRVTSTAVLVVDGRDVASIDLAEVERIRAALE